MSRYHYDCGAAPRVGDVVERVAAGTSYTDTGKMEKGSQYTVTSIHDDEITVKEADKYWMINKFKLVRRKTLDVDQNTLAANITCLLNQYPNDSNVIAVLKNLANDFGIKVTSTTITTYLAQ
jgi:hypothetical protein